MSSNIETTTLGAVLKARRESLGKSIEQISAQTRIHSKIILALEQDHYDKLPARTFTRGFIVTYCKTLGLNSDDLLQTFHSFLEEKFKERPNKEEGHRGYVFEPKEQEQNKRWLTVGGIAGLAFVIAVAFVFKPKNKHSAEKHKEFEQKKEASKPEEIPAPDFKTEEPISSSTVASTPSVAPSAAPSTIPSVSATVTVNPSPTPATPKPSASPTPSPNASPEASPSETPKTDPLNKGDTIPTANIKRRILLEALDDVMVTYQSDERPETSFLLKKGRFLVVRGEKKVRFKTSNPEKLQYKTKSSTYQTLSSASFEIGDDGSLLPAAQ